MYKCVLSEDGTHCTEKDKSNYPIIPIKIEPIDIPDIHYSYTYFKPIGNNCSSNLECKSGCCSSDKCSDSSKCEKLVRTVYICEAVLGFAFNIAFTIYVIIKLKRIKEDFKKKLQKMFKIIIKKIKSYN